MAGVIGLRRQPPETDTTDGGRKTLANSRGADLLVSEGKPDSPDEEAAHVRAHMALVERCDIINGRYRADGEAAKSLFDQPQGVLDIIARHADAKTERGKILQA